VKSNLDVEQMGPRLSSLRASAVLKLIVVLSLRAQDVVFIGLRDALPCEVVFFNKYKIPAFTMKEIDQLGIKEVSLIINLVTVKVSLWVEQNYREMLFLIRSLSSTNTKFWHSP
jgi:hypothetical protein